jgi:hypothetical protein
MIAQVMGMRSWLSLALLVGVLSAVASSSAAAAGSVPCRVSAAQVSKIVGTTMKRYPNPAECDYADPGNRLFTVTFTPASASSIRQQIAQVKSHHAGLSGYTTSGFAHDGVAYTVNPSATGGQPAMLSLFFVGAHTGWVFMLGATKASGHYDRQSMARMMAALRAARSW